VVIDIPPRARVAATPGTGNKRTAFSFGSAGSLGKLVGYAWSFGDGSSASTPAATHVYGSPGTFTVRLTVTDDSGRTSSDQTHVVVKNALPVPGFSYRSRVKRAVSFDGALSSDADGRVRAYRWSFGDGAVGAGRTTTHRYRGTKTRYTVTLVVTDDSGARGSIRRSISVRPGAGDISVAESIVVTDVPGLIPPAGITDIETIGASDGTAPIHHPSPRRLSNQQRRER
jgi:PKD repeat protein